MGSWPKNPIDDLQTIDKSKIDYKCVVYKSASRRELESLEPASNEAIRISCGCLKIYNKIQATIYHKRTSAPYKKRSAEPKVLQQSEKCIKKTGFHIHHPEQETLYVNKISPPLFGIIIKKMYTNLYWRNEDFLLEIKQSICP